MFRWEDVEDQTIFGMTVKMYRDPYVPADSFVAPFNNAELDHYAFAYLGSELLMYRILDTNFELYMEERGNLARLNPVKIATRQKISETIF